MYWQLRKVRQEVIGDEPYQMHQKFPSVTVAVDESVVMA